MDSFSSKSSRGGVAVLYAVGMLSGLYPVARADVDPHAEEDTFAAEAAALLPAGELQIAAATAPADRITLGEWGAVIPWTPHIPVSAATLPDGRVLTFASNQRTTFPAGTEFTYAATWNPATGVFAEYNHTSHDMFCGGIVMLPDGRVLVNGGRNTTVRSSLFDWRVNTWTRTPNMNDSRWYNTTVALPNGRAWTVTGDGGSGTAERWDSASGWSRLTGINWNPILAEPGYIIRWHPFLLVAPDGRLIHFGPTDTMHWVSPDGSGSVVNTGKVVPGSHYPKEGSWVMYNEGRILVAGGGTSTTANVSDTTTGNSTNAAYTVDVRTGTPVITPVAAMTFKRQFANAVVLPTGEVMIMGGNTSGRKFNDTGSILTPEIWNPTTRLWRIAADHAVPRNYHSLALLLPDGRVLCAGGGLSGNSADHRDGELYTPPTLFNADGSLATRPVLSAAPQTIGVATKFTVSGTAGLQKFSLIKMSGITHSVNTDLRYLSLPFITNSPGNYLITAHSNLNVMTPGYWMLFGLNAAGVHSVAKIILVDATSAVSIATPGNQASYVGQAAALQMIGSGPVGSVLNWSATGLPTGLAINGATGLISGTPTALGAFPVQVTLTNATSSATANFVWTIQPVTFSQNYTTFSGASGLTLNGNATLAGSVLRLTTNSANQVGSAFLSSPIPIGANTSISTRWVFRNHGSADGGDGLTFVIQGIGPTSIGTGGGGLGYGGISQSLAVEVDNYQGGGDPNANHIAILSNGNVTVHLATNTPGWDLENALSHTIWVDYDGPVNQLRVYAAQGNIAQRPANPVMTTTIDLPALVVSGQAWFGFTGGTGGAFNNQDIESWSLSVNAFSLPAQPVLTAPGNGTNVIGTAVNRQMQATDPNGDLLAWSATGLPTGLSIHPASGLVTGTPTVVGVYSPTVTVTDNNTLPVSANFTWSINNLLTVQPLAGPAVVAGTTVALTAQSSGGLNPRYRWNFGDGTPDTAFSSSPSTSHTFVSPGRFLVTVIVRDDTAREVTASYYQAVYAPPTATRPTASTSIIYEPRTNSNSRLWAVNPDNDSVTIFDAITRAKLAEVNVGRAPRTLALATDGRVWVANAESATLTIIQTNFTIAQTVNLARGSRPFGLVFHPGGQNAYVALEGSGRILKLNPTTGATVATLNVGPNVRHLSVTANGAQILATRFITPRLPGEETANPQTTVLGVKHGGEVLTINPTTFAIVSTVILEHSERPDTSVSARGIPNYLGAAVISPDGQSAWVPSKQDNIKRGHLRSGGTLTHDMSLRSIASRINLATQAEDLAGRIDFDDTGITSASAFDPQGVFLFSALEASREVAVADAVAKQEILRFPAGRAPQGLVLSPDGRTLFVHNFMDRTISVHDLNTLANGSVTPPPAPVFLNCVTTEKLSANVLLGKQIFYDAQDNRIALQQYISCASCHNDGGQDGRVWDFTQFGEGLRNTTTLRGHGGTAQGPLHWTGNFDEVQDFEGQLRNFAGGTGLMSDANFHTGTRSQPLGDPKAGFSADLDALAAYLTSLTTNGDSPDRNADGTFTSAAVAGQSVFQQQNCIQCHAGSQFTDSALNVLHNVGTLKPSSGQRLGAALTGLDTPTLRGLWANAPYLHDGSAATLEAAVSAHNGVALNGTDLSNLVAFLRQLDDEATTPPTISNISDRIATVNTAMAAIVFTINDAETAASNLVVSAGSSNTNLVPTNNMVFGGSGSNRTLTITPGLHQIGTATITVTVSDGQMAANDTFVLTVNPEQLTVTGITANNKVYDNTTAATLNTDSAVLVGVVNPDVVTLSTAGATGAFTTKTVGNGKLVQISGLTLSGANAGNYTLVSPTANANITAKVLTVTGITAGNKVYDGITAATLSTGSAALVGVVSPDVVTLETGSATGAFTTATVGTGKLVSLAGLTLGGADAGNYTLTQPAATADITARGLTVTGITAGNKVYDGTTAATLSTGGAALVGVVSPDAVTLNPGGATGTFTDAALGNGKVVTVAGLTLGGADAANYTVTQPTASANITAKGLTVSGIAANNKVYDGNMTAMLNTGSAVLVGVASGDDVALTATGVSGTQAFTNAATITIPLSGAASPYPSVINVTGMGGTVNNVTISLLGLGHSYPDDIDILLVGPAGQKVMILSDVGGGGAGFVVTNLNITLDDAAVGSIPDAGPMVSGTFKPRDASPGEPRDVFPVPAPVGPYATNLFEFNGFAANGTWSLWVHNDGLPGNVDSGIIAGGWSLTVTADGVSSTFESKQVGIGKPVAISGLALSGADAGNYTLTQPTATANITAVDLLVTGITAADKPYDGTAAAALSTGGAALATVLAGDVVTLNTGSAAGAFANSSVGSGKLVSVSGLTTSGADAGNYNLVAPTTTANITAKAVTPVIVASNKPYDGTTTATLSSQSVTGTIGADVVTLGVGAANFDTKHIGVGKPVTGTTLTLGGADAGNYVLSAASATALADITAKTVTPVIVANDKPYDGSTTATLRSQGVTGTIGADVVTLSVGAANFGTKSVGLGKTVTATTLTLGGVDVGNYVLGALSASDLADIAAKTVTPVIVANDKPYDGNTTATLSSQSVTGMIGAEVVTLGVGVANFDTKHIGIGKTVTGTTLTLSGADAGNYALSAASATTTASITAKAVTPVIVANDKPYDGSTTATLSSQSVTGTIGAEVVTLGVGSAKFDTKNIGISKTVTATTLSLGGADAGNYVLNAANVSDQANITAAVLTVSGITAGNKVYDGNPVATLNVAVATLVGVIGSDVVMLSTAGVSGAFNTPTVGTGKTVQVAGLTIGGADAGNYMLTQPTALANITLKSLTMTADSKSRTYGAANPTFTGTLVELQSGDNITASFATVATPDSPAGNYQITVQIQDPDGKLRNYSVTTINGLLKIIKAQATVTAHDKTRAYGATNPTLTATIAGFVNGETLVTSGVTGSPNLSTTATNGSPTGSYPITATTGSLTAANYSFSFGDGTLTITAPGNVTISSIARLENYHARITGTGDAGVIYRIQASFNLVNWQDIGTVTAAENGEFEFEDPGATHLSSCFYRVSLP